MPRSIKKSIATPIREGLIQQVKSGILDYPSENSAWIGLARYQLLIGKPHPVTAAISRMHPDDQDAIDDFLLEVATRGLSLKGQFLGQLIHRAIAGTEDPSEQEVADLIPAELLRMAREWKKDSARVMEEVAEYGKRSGSPPRGK